MSEAAITDDELAEAIGALRHYATTPRCDSNMMGAIDIVCRHAEVKRARAEALEEAAEELSHRAFLCHTHDEFGKGRERGLLDGMEYVRALKEKPDPLPSPPEEE